MKKLVKFKLLSDVITGGVRTATNFLESENFISGAVLRAGFASDILLECPYADEEYEEKVNYVFFREKEKCKNCANISKCREFGNMKFSFLYPENCLPAPFTLRKCKAGGTDHAVMDVIAQNGRLKCPKCAAEGKDGRMEDVKGFVDADGSEKSVSKNTTVHTAIDINTGTALDGSLFSISAIKRGQIYCGEIDDRDTGMIYPGAVVRVGKYSSNGFGKLRVEEITDCPEPDIETAVTEFNRKFGENLKRHYGEKKEFAAILLKSDAVLGLEDETGLLSSEDYKKIWQEHLFSPDKNSALKLEQIFAQNFCYSGFDTAVKTNSDIERRKAPVIVTEKGTSILVSFTDSEAALNELKRIYENGIGRDTETGYGKTEICCSLHLLGIY